MNDTLSILGYAFLLYAIIIVRNLIYWFGGVRDSFEYWGAGYIMDTKRSFTFKAGIFLASMLILLLILFLIKWLL